MQYKTNTKIIIDKRKLDILLRLNCPKDVLYDAIVYNKITKTNDELIDDNLEALIDIKEFSNWGGKRSNSGRKNHLENQVENHLENQESNQVVDKDKDIDKDIDLFINKYRSHFEKEYKRVFKNKPFLSQQDCYKIIELSTVYSPEIITEAIEKLKNINFDDINFKPTASWLLKDNNFERVMNGEFDRQEESITDFLNEWAKKGAENEH